MSSGQSEGLPGVDDRLEATVGQYRIVRRIGQGGMGIVYEAIHRAIGQRAAIKVLASAGARRSNYFERFANEARAASAVAHPGLVKVFDFGKLADGTPYILMEYLEGEVLRARLERLRKLPLEMAVQIIRQIASALSAVHAGGIVHRDVKPENVVMVADDVADTGERPKLLDFGVARVDSGASSLLTDPGMVIGTPVYMSPEQCSGATVDWSSDVYSLGVMACEMLTGALPHAAHGQAAMQAHLDDTVRPVLRDVPEPIAALVYRMLAKQPWHRPTAAVVASELQMPKNGTLPFVFAPTLENSAGQAAVAKKRPSRRARRWLVAGTLLGSLFLGGVAAKVGIGLRRSPKAPAVELTGMVRLPGGTFTMGLTPEQVVREIQDECAADRDCRPEFYQRQQPARAVTLSPFYLDQHEVTNAELVEWLNTAPESWQIDEELHSPRFIRERATGRLLVDLHYMHGGVLVVNQGKVAARPGYEQRAAVQVTWDAARAYCTTHGKRLPTEAEWEFAARGVAPRRYPWGETEPTCDTVVHGRDDDGKCKAWPQHAEDVSKGSLDDTPEGVHGMGGNVTEWVADAFNLLYPDCGECVNPRFDADAKARPEDTWRVIRGAGWDMAILLQSTRRSRWNQTNPSKSIGFRCAVEAK